jgi:hypothetical protein
MKKIGSILLIAAASIALIFGISAIFNYKKKLDSYQPVNAHIVSTKVEEHTSTSSRGGTSTSYEPVVHFKFWVNDREFESSSVFPQYVNWGSGSDWAYKIIGKFKEGMEVDAFYDPALPGNAFLIKQYPFVYYGFFVCLPMFFVLFGIHLLTQSKNTLKKPIPPVKLDSQQFEILPYIKPSEYKWATLVMFTIAVSMGLWTFWHYFSHAQPPYEKMAYYFVIFYGVIFLIITRYLIHFLMLGRSIDDARIYTDTHDFFLGQTFNAKVHQEYKKKMSIEKVTLVLKSEAFLKGGKGVGTHSYSHHTKRKTVLKDRHVDKGEAVEIPCKLKIPPDKQPTTLPGEKVDPRYKWRLELKISIRNRPDYRAKYPIIVEKSE